MGRQREDRKRNTNSRLTYLSHAISSGAIFLAPLFFGGVDMNLEKVKLSRGMKIKVTWTDGEETQGTFVGKERGYIVIEQKGKIQACLPTHLKNLEIINNG